MAKNTGIARNNQTIRISPNSSFPRMNYRLTPITTQQAAIKMAAAIMGAMAGETIPYSRFQPAARSRISADGSTGARMPPMSLSTIPTNSSTAITASARVRIGPTVVRPMWVTSFLWGTLNRREKICTEQRGRNRS